MNCVVEDEWTPPGTPTPEQELCLLDVYITYLENLVDCGGVQACCDGAYAVYKRNALGCIYP